MNANYVVSSCLTALLIFAANRDSTCAEATFGYPPQVSLDVVREWINKAAKDHPRLLATKSEFKALRNSVDSDETHRLVAAAVISQAEQLLTVEPVQRVKQGRRLLDQSRRCVKRVVTLAMAYHLTLDAKYARRCEKEMMSAARFSDWNPSHFLDVAEMTFALAIGYDWLFDQLGADARKEIRSAIVKKGVELPFTTRHKGWVKSRNNWGQVCHGGLTAGALAVLEHEPELAARTVHNALENVTYSMAAYAPHGSYPEGPGYWSYGTSYNVLLLAVLESTLGTDFGLSKAPGFDQTGQFVSLACGPSGLFFNYADGGATRQPQSALFWLASRFQRPDWLIGERERWEKSVAHLSQRTAASSRGRLVPIGLLWMNGSDRSGPNRMPLHWQSKGETPVTVHRSSWSEAAATYVGVKAGSPSANHGQMDIGSFVLDADGLRWAIDLGAEGYHGIESRGMNLWSRKQDSDRWKIFRQSNSGHNTLVIDGQLQRADGHGRIVDFSDDPKFPYTIVDLTSVYRGQAASIRRGIALLPTREVLIQDEIRGLRPESHVRWGMITRALPDTTGGAALRLRSEQQQLTLSCLAPAGSAWRTIDVSKPRNEWDSPNPGTRMVALELKGAETGALTIRMLATPGSCTESARDRLEPVPLDRWSDGTK